jgi:hypothetical protein
MTQLELIEIIQQHSAVGYKEIRSGLNRASQEYAAKTELYKKTFTQNSVAGQRYYELSPRIIKVLRVQINDVEIPRLVGSPIIDDDEFDGSTGLTSTSSASNDRYWYIDSGRIGIVEKALVGVSKDGRTSNYQSISEVKEIRLYTIAQPSDFSTSLNQVSEFPPQFHEALAYKVISDEYLKVANKDLDSHKIFYTKFMHEVKAGRKYARANYLQDSIIKQVDF